MIRTSVFGVIVLGLISELGPTNDFFNMVFSVPLSDVRYKEGQKESSHAKSLKVHQTSSPCVMATPQQSKGTKKSFSYHISNSVDKKSQWIPLKQSLDFLQSLELFKRLTVFENVAPQLVMRFSL